MELKSEKYKLDQWLLAAVAESCENALKTLDTSQLVCIIYYEQIELLMHRCKTNYDILNRKTEKAGVKMAFSGTELMVILTLLPLLEKEYIDILLQQLKDFAHKELVRMQTKVQQALSPVTERKLLSPSQSHEQPTNTWRPPSLAENTEG
jgi:hypothetical protein